jgi:hypothetical protein
MRDTGRSERLSRSCERRLIPVVTVVSGVLLAGCGGSSSRPTTATAGRTTASASTVAAATTTTGAKSAASPVSGAGQAAVLLAFAKCMRANGVPNFPDPAAGGGARFPVPVGSNPAAPSFRAAQAKCQKVLPGGGLPGSGPPPSAQTMTRLRRIAVCMRQHGVPQFPDPRTRVPPNPSSGGFQEITDFDGAILLFPTTINLQAPAYRQALAACGAPPLGLPH